MLKSKYLKSAMNGERIWRLLCWAMLSHSVVFDSFQPHGLWPVKLLCPWGFSRKNTGLGCHALLQGIFPTQGSNSGLLHFRQILYNLNHPGSPRMLEWVAYPFSRGSSWPRNWTGVSCIAGEGNGNQLQCSCLENPRDGGARWAAVYGVAQSQTRLKRLSSSSSSTFKKDANWRKY